MTTLSDESLSSWDTNASFWDDAIGVNGNKYWQRLQVPCLDRLLGPKLSQTPCNALELSTGNGLGARWLASHGATVLATDGSLQMMQCAKAHGDSNGRIQFGDKVDVTNINDFQPLIQHAESIGGFDIILMNMAIQDVADLDPLGSCLPKLLKKDGVFVAQLLHPVFMTSMYSRQLNVSFNPKTGKREVVAGKLITEYLHIDPYKGIANENQPDAHIYFHRPMHELLGVFFKHRLVVDGLEEPSFTENDVELNRIESTTNFPQLPALLAFRVRRAT